MPDQRNLLIAIVLSIVILIGFQVFLVPPMPEPRDDRVTETTLGDPATGTDGGDALGLSGADNVGLFDDSADPSALRTQAIEDTPRVVIDTAHTLADGTVRGVHGSISLLGGYIDDLTLAGYRETTDPQSPEIVLLSPRQAVNPYFVDVGWTYAEGTEDRPLTTGQMVWEADRDSITIGETVTLTHELDNGLRLERAITIDENYMFSVTQRVVNGSNASVTIRPFSRVRRIGTPSTLGYFILHEGPYGVFNGTLEEYDYEDIIDAEQGTVDHGSVGGWLGFTDKYWLVAIIPDQAREMSARFIHRSANGIDQYFAIYQLDAVTVPPGETIENTNLIFAGAKEVEVIDGYETQYGIDNFELAIDFGWFYFLTKPFFYALAYINGIVGNFGVAILIFTVFIKLVFFPLANKSYKAMSKMKALQPEMMRLRERYQEDRQKMNMELMALYKREKVNPASGCLPILIQIPVFFALYKVLFVTIEMRHAPFFGWVQDLSAPDPTSIFNLFGLIPWDPPMMLMIGVWPLLMGITMYLQQKVNPAPADPLQQKIFMMLPIVFTFVLAGFPAGLVIYWAWNNLLSIGQQVIIMRRMGVKIGGGRDVQAPAAASGPAPAGGNGSGNGNGNGNGSGRAKGSRKQVWTSSSEEAADDGDAVAAAPIQSRPRPKKGQSKGQGRQAARRRAGGGQRRRP